MTPAEIEKAKSFAQRWRPSPRTGAHCWIRKRVPRGSKCMIKNWFVPPIVIPILIVLGLVVYVTVRAFH